MPQTFSTRGAAHWLNRHAHLSDSNLKINTRYVKRLNRECRLLPEARGFFGRRYTLEQLKKYADEVRPR